MVKDPNIQMWADIVKSQTRILKEDVSEDEILANVFASLLRFVAGENDKIMKDQEWLNYIINDINAAVRKKLFVPEPDDQKYLDKINHVDEE